MRKFRCRVGDGTTKVIVSVRAERAAEEFAAYYCELCADWSDVDGIHVLNLETNTETIFDVEIVPVPSFQAYDRAERW